MQFVMKPVILGAAMCCAAAANAGGVSTTCLNQSPIGYGSIYSDGVPGQYWGTRYADNFTPPPGMVISAVRWVGASENYMSPDLTNFTDFVVQVLNDRFGQVWTTTLPTTSVAVETTGATTPSGGVEWLFSAELPVRIPPQDPGQHWISVGSINLDPLADGFQWAVSEGGDGVIAVASPFDGVTPFVTTPGPFDLAFEVCFEPSMLSRQPDSLIIVAPGAAPFEVEVFAPPYRSESHTFQWMRDGEPLVDGGNVTGAQSPLLVIDPATPADAGVYTVIVSDGAVSEQSRPAYLGVRTCGADANADGLVNFSDLNAVLVQFGFDCAAD